MALPVRTYVRELDNCVCGHPVAWHARGEFACNLCDACFSALTEVDMGDACAWCGNNLNGQKILFCYDCRDAGLDEDEARQVLDGEWERSLEQRGSQVARAQFGAAPGWTGLFDALDDAITSHQTQLAANTPDHHAAAWFAPGNGIALTEACCTSFTKKLRELMEVSAVTCQACGSPGIVRGERVECERHAGAYPYGAVA